LENIRSVLAALPHDGHHGAERMALRQKFRELSNHWEAHQHVATPDTRRKFDEVRKNFEERAGRK
jgi:hypothetical protein